ncbi:hypothetical protein [Dysgonomonas reticulitermitis]
MRKMRNTERLQCSGLKKFRPTRQPPETATSYEWYEGSTLVATTPDNTYSIPDDVKNVAGTYSYTVKTINECSDTTSATPAIVKVIDLASLPAGTGNFTGKICFDIAYSNFEGECGTEAARLTQKTDFALTDEQDPKAGTSTPIYTGT